MLRVCSGDRGIFSPCKSMGRLLRIVSLRESVRQQTRLRSTTTSNRRTLPPFPAPCWEKRRGTTRSKKYPAPASAKRLTPPPPPIDRAADALACTIAAPARPSVGSSRQTKSRYRRGGTVAAKIVQRTAAPPSPPPKSPNRSRKVAYSYYEPEFRFIFVAQKVKPTSLPAL